jgi:hypothetical protein
MQAKRDGILSVDEVRAESFGKDPLTGPDGDEPEDKDAPTRQEQNPDKAAGDTAEDAPDTAKSLQRSLTEADLTTLAHSRAAEMESLARAITPSLTAFLTAQEERMRARLSKDVFKSVAIDKDVDDYAALLYESEYAFPHALLFGLLVASLDSGITSAPLQIGISLSLKPPKPTLTPMDRRWKPSVLLRCIKG